MLERSLRSLYGRSDGVSGLGAAVEYLSHSAPLSMMVVSFIPSHRGTKHLDLRLLPGARGRYLLAIRLVPPSSTRLDSADNRLTTGFDMHFADIDAFLASAAHLLERL